MNEYEKHDINDIKTTDLIKFMINNIQYNFKAKYNKNFEDFLKKNF